MESNCELANQQSDHLADENLIANDLNIHSTSKNVIKQYECIGDDFYLL